MQTLLTASTGASEKASDSWACCGLLLSPPPPPPSHPLPPPVYATRPARTCTPLGRAVRQHQYSHAINADAARCTHRRSPPTQPHRHATLAAAPTPSASTMTTRPAGHHEVTQLPSHIARIYMHALPCPAGLPGLHDAAGTHPPHAPAHVPHTPNARAGTPLLHPNCPHATQIMQTHSHGCSAGIRARRTAQHLRTTPGLQLLHSHACRRSRARRSWAMRATQATYSAQR